MNVTEDLSILSLIANASLLVKLVMALLGTVSFMSWYWIFRKWFAIRDAKKKTDLFERDFWSGGDLNALYQSAATAATNAAGMERIFEAGYREFAKLRGKSLDHGAVMDGARRAMRATYQRESGRPRSPPGLPRLGRLGQPYVGLFGTVWGIMNAFRGLANVGQPRSPTVAPGIAEALVATAIGLFAAIPAVVAYNRFAHDIDRMAIRFESFMEEFSNILQRQLR
jgi:biopolymer transport protein TolQ